VGDYPNPEFTELRSQYLSWISRGKTDVTFLSGLP
jgi:hypothetical protein